MDSPWNAPIDLKTQLFGSAGLPAAQTQSSSPAASHVGDLRLGPYHSSVGQPYNDQGSHPSSSQHHRLPPLNTRRLSETTEPDKDKPRKRRQPALSRFEACQRCRDRKVKCDVLRPACTPCRRSAIASGNEPDDVVCQYARKEAQPRLRSSAGSSAPVFKAEAPATAYDAQPDWQEMIRALEQRNQILERQLADLASASHARSVISARTATAASPGMSSTATDLASIWPEVALQANGNVFLGVSGSSNLATAPAAATPLPDLTSFELDPQLMPADEASLQQMLYPGWPITLPSPALVSALCNAFFSKSHLCSHTVSKARFMAALDLPPRHPDFPHTSLIHSVCCIGSSLLAPEAYGIHLEQYWAIGGDPSPAAYHANQARYAWVAGLSDGHKLLDMAQATSLLVFFALATAKFTEVWAFCGLATRTCLPLELNKIPRLEFRSDPGAVDNRPRRFFFPPSKDCHIYHERSETFWTNFMCDRFASVSTGWAGAIDEKDITSLLPSQIPEVLETVTEDEAVAALFIRSPQFFTCHPNGLVGPRQLDIKAVILLGRATYYVQRLPPPFGDGDALPGCTRESLIESPEFRRLDAELVAFRLSFPPAYRNFSQALGDRSRALFDVELITAHTVPHCSTILLHEPFVSLNATDLPRERCLASARSILSIINVLRSSSYDLSLLATFAIHCWSVAGRTFIREHAIRNQMGDRTRAEEAFRDIQQIIEALRIVGRRFKLGIIVAGTLSGLLADSDSCLPKALGPSDIGMHVNTRNWRAKYAASNTSSRESATPASSIETPSSAAMQPTLSKDISQILLELEAQSHTHAAPAPSELQSMLDRLSPSGWQSLLYPI
ncbi:uncharacterized protein L969DRAFT_19952 [Mixia osmundae IAM 14324]|uniref:Zn(2)-C6 fungal-type domain-containing protein n=1 Tax=Mixia osmundae (strain CBS 9802 / IAM 14324 / JCM 22182 / KY 12970) TaxID=764103 RepID=G7E2M6_MIXOS|nr:uncharacterized protein L969DRAFT_19952 [Mixia osmundae IAM 14324]KEI36951.1 hypothetical protein L969DRAFT_19952 [Mixia osmundae IAM 14324]GAA97086.1 hypothetical protein E5Q_03761 [Mixia osmundae IAM 14324]